MVEHGARSKLKNTNALFQGKWETLLCLATKENAPSSPVLSEPHMNERNEAYNKKNMDDSDHVCPLCCEDLDISDRQFFPCKCGYQVCMWCWHRIREQETGLCPACRTPYGDDPHAFSAVDVDEVLKANKEKEAAAKRERLKTMAICTDATGINIGIENTELGFRGTGTMELPRDRTQLANMRVIRRNLVYAVGLPPSIASEDILKKPEYFGQYGKISKIVLNRGNTTTPSTIIDPRRISASAYVTFAHKEDTLSCILALDGFLIENRNIRASYGTSKYCSAFIKNVRCSNPECTYLHCMGETEDTFTKQEIQAGYVTSGRDVLARQQQIVAQALAAGQTLGSRRKVGGGGASGTGKSTVSPVFPPPTYDEQPKPSFTGIMPVQTVRSATITASTNNPISIPHPVLAPRAVSLGRISPPLSGGSSGVVSDIRLTGSQTLASMAAAPQRRSLMPAPLVAPVSAASVVAGVHTLGNTPVVEPPAPHTTLTPLTPLKRTIPKGTKAPGPPNLSTIGDLSTMKLSTLRSKSFSHNNGVTIGSGSISPALLSATKLSGNNDFSLGSIGGAVIGGIGTMATSLSAGGGAIGTRNSGLSTLHNNESSDYQDNLTGSGSLFGGLESQHHTKSTGGVMFTTEVNSRNSITSGVTSDKWIGASISGSNDGFGIGGGDIWGGRSTLSGSGTLGNSSGFLSTSGELSGSIGGGFIGGAPIGGSFGGPIRPGGQSNGSSTLASMLGINLPTGSGSLRESSSSLFDIVGQPQAPFGYSNGLSSIFAPGVIGGGPQTRQNPVPIGGNTRRVGNIGGGGRSISGSGLSFTNTQLGSIGNGAGNNNDIVLLQTLLPGVHITSGSSQLSTAPGGFRPSGSGNWQGNSLPSQHVIGGNVVGLNQGGYGHTWNGDGSDILQSRAAPGGGIIGQSGKLSQKQNQNIW